MPKHTQAKLASALHSTGQGAGLYWGPCDPGGDPQSEATPGQSHDSCFTDTLWHFSQLENLEAQHIDPRNGAPVLSTYFFVPELSA